MYDGTNFTPVRQAAKGTGGEFYGRVTPEEIDALVREANKMRAAVIGEMIANLIAAPVLRYRRWKTTRTALQELQGLDDRMLSDIGVTRDQIRALTHNANHVAATARGEMLADFVRKHVAEPLARWRLRTRTHRELAALDNAMLRDIGIERGQIDGIARAVSEGKFVNAGTPVPVGLALGWIDLPVPANSNNARPAAAVVTDAAD